MRARSIVILHVALEDVAKVLLACHHDVVEAFPAYRADQPFGISVLPWRTCRCWMIANAGRPPRACRLRVYAAEGEASPEEVPPPLSPRRYWSRRGIAEWLEERLAEGAPTLVGIDHGFSFPLRYFEAHSLIPTGLPSSTIFSATGRPTTITPMSISSATASTATARRAWAMPAGGA